MLRYNNFLEDLVLERMINESALYYTREVKEKLYNLRLRSKIAQDLIDVEYTDVSPDMTLISFGSEKGNIKFFQMNNFLSQLKKYFKAKLEKTWDSNLDKWLEGYLKKVKEAGLSQTDLKTLWEDPEVGLQDARSRVETGIGRFVNKVFPGKYTDQEVAKFIEMFKGDEVQEDQFQLITGDEIIKWYNVNNYVAETYHLGDSCMRKADCEDYFSIYTENPEVCQLLIMKEGDKIKGRAIVWKLSKGLGGSEYLMDRVYAIDEPTRLLFDDWANERGYLRRFGYSQSEMKKFYLKDQVFTGEIRVQLKEWLFDEYPYMDTFKKLHVKSGVLHNDRDESEYGFYVLQSTSGGFEDTTGRWSSYYDERIDPDDAVYSEPLDDWIIRDSAIEVTLGRNRNRGWYPDDFEDITYDQFRDEWIHADESTYSEYYGGYIYEDDAIEVVTDVDIYRGRLNFTTDTLSDYDSNVISVGKLEACSYLEENYEYYSYFVGDILKKNEDNKYYFREYEEEVYDVDGDRWNQIDIEVLGLEKTGSFYKTDIFAYNYSIEDKVTLAKAIEDKIKEIEYKQSGSQLKIGFAQYDDEVDAKNLEQKLKQYKERLAILKLFL
jgi:hypothetical protein